MAGAWVHECQTGDVVKVGVTRQDSEVVRKCCTGDEDVKRPMLDALAPVPHRSPELGRLACDTARVGEDGDRS